MMSDRYDDHFRPDLGSRDVTLDRVQAVAFTPMDMRARNQLITVAYGDIADSMAELLGTADASFCALGQWASAAIADYLTVPIPFIRRMVAHPFGFGNRHIFAEVARAHVSFLDTVGAAHRTGGDLDAAWAACEARLRAAQPWPPGTPATARDRRPDDETAQLDVRAKVRWDNEFMIDGLRAQCDALRTDDLTARSQLILSGNILIAAHEQLQLESSISLGFRTFVRQCTTAWRLLETKHEWHNHPPGARRLRIESWWIRFATRRLVAVSLPWGSVKVGDGVQRSEHAVDIDGDVARKLALGSPVDGRPCVCWADWNDRMAYIAALLAADQRHPRWFDAAGKVRRPDTSAKLEQYIAKRDQRVDAPHVPPARPTSCAWSDEDLDALRMQPSNERAPDLVDLPLSRVANYDGKPIDAANAIGQRMLDVAGDVAARLEPQRLPGGLLDDATVAAARETFTANETSMFMGLLFGSLPDAYAAASGVRVLGAVSDFAADPFRRAGETARFLRDLLTPPDDAPGSMDLDGVAVRSVTGVRGMHAVVSERLLVDGWDTEQHGIPVNQEDVLGTMFTFVLGPFEMFDRLGMDTLERVRDDYTRFWCGIGHLLGLPYEVVTVPHGTGRRAYTYAEATEVMALIRHRNHRVSLDGVRLTEALLDGIGEGFPRWMDWLPLGMVLSVGDPDINSYLLIGEGRGRRRAAFVGAMMRRMFGSRSTRRPARWLIERAGDYWVAPFIDIGASMPFRRAPTEQEIEGVAEAVGVVNAELWPTGC